MMVIGNFVYIVNEGNLGQENTNLPDFSGSNPIVVD